METSLLVAFTFHFLSALSALRLFAQEKKGCHLVENVNF